MPTLNTDSRTDVIHKRCKPLLLASAISCVIFGNDWVQAQEQPTVSARQTQTYEIPAQSLDAALVAWSQSSGVQLFADASQTQDLRSTAIQGNYSSAEALNLLLGGTGLVGHFTADDRVMLDKAPEQGGALELSTLAISGKAPGSTTEGTGSYTTYSSSSSTRLNLSLRETPQSITVVTRQRIEDQKLDDLVNVAEATTGVSITRGSYGADGPGLYARGLSINNFQIDGVPTSSGLGNFLQNTAIYDRVEIVRGATGMMSGLGSPSATFNMIRKRPTFEPQISFAAEAGSWDRYGATLDVAGPLNEEANIRVRLVASYKDKNSWIDNFKKEESLIYGISEFDLDERTLLTVGFSNQKQNNTPMGNGVALYFSNGQRTRVSPSDHRTLNWAYYDHEVNNIFASLERSFDSGWNAKAELSQSWYKYDSMFARMTGVVSQETGNGEYVYPIGRWKGDPKQTNLDTYITGQFPLFGREHELITGVTLSKIEEDLPEYDGDIYPGGGYDGDANFYTWGGDAPKPILQRVGVTKRDEYQSSAYLSARFNLSDSLKFISGARVTDWKRDRDKTTYETGVSELTKSRETGVFIPYFGLIQDINENWSVYGSYTKIFQPQRGGVKDINNSPLLPEEGISYEVGVKASVYDGRLISSFALFKTKQDNLAVYVAPDYYSAESGTTAQGVEFELNGELAEGWQFSTGYSYSVITDRNDKRINTMLPRHSLKTFTSYRLPGALENLTVGGGMNWQSKTGRDLSAYTQDSYALFNLMAKYEFDEHVSGTMNINNVLNKEYIAGYGASSHGFFGEPRNLMVSLKYQY